MPTRKRGGRFSQRFALHVGHVKLGTSAEVGAADRKRKVPNVAWTEADLGLYSLGDNLCEYRYMLFHMECDFIPAYTWKSTIRTPKSNRP